MGVALDVDDDKAEDEGPKSVFEMFLLCKAVLTVSKEHIDHDGHMGVQPG